MTGKWTRHLMDNLRPWVVSGFGKVNHSLSQFFTEHGYFRLFLFRINKLRTPDYMYCGNDVEHRIFECPRWTKDICHFEHNTGDLMADNIVTKMLRNENCWTAVTTFVVVVLIDKKAEGCLESG